jgi:hypothetical protein
MHQEAGGTGTYADPITFAGSKSAIKPGGRIYLPRLQKYFIMEDDCEECDKDWKKKKEWHVDLWMGPDTLGKGGLIACENQLTKMKDQIIVNPAATLPVIAQPLFTYETGCIEHAEPCVDKGTACGNSCEIPDAATCPELAKDFFLNLTRFEQLNSKLDCSGTVPKGKSVCIGGTCGGR